MWLSFKKMSVKPNTCWTMLTILESIGLAFILFNIQWSISLNSLINPIQFHKEIHLCFMYSACYLTNSMLKTLKLLFLPLNGTYYCVLCTLCFDRHCCCDVQITSFENQWIGNKYFLVGRYSVKWVMPMSVLCRCCNL